MQPDLIERLEEVRDLWESPTDPPEWGYPIQEAITAIESLQARVDRQLEIYHNQRASMNKQDNEITRLNAVLDHIAGMHVIGITHLHKVINNMCEYARNRGDV